MPKPGRSQSQKMASRPSTDKASTVRLVMTVSWRFGMDAPAVASDPLARPVQSVSNKQAVGFQTRSILVYRSRRCKCEMKAGSFVNTRYINQLSHRCLSLTILECRSAVDDSGKNIAI